ncbi:flagella basal body P-ring formation protein FlgA [Nitrosomonas sp. Nm51]|uniref:flagellar basal body P-ring formation chaperone FlgA n=1 Tax=Nitrosomonas sp. Nm51 TaxID=133720 RepID=UPI0008B11B4F|nr:flagellar basal body P-ring formation chaperone FlgA [Nitrosomonas sp. Nm51]SER12185.1 flagella basal body P-ring formation protein FlgA [Nitrosomonas sp. Nm51]
MRRKTFQLCILLVTAKLSVNLFAESHNSLSQYQEIPLIKKAVEDFVYSHANNSAGDIQVEVGQIDQRITLPKCEKLNVFMPSGSRLWGKTSVGVRCDGQVSWTIYVQAEIRIMADVLHVTQPLSRDHTINYGDLALQTVNLTQIPEGVLTDYSQAVGKIAVTNLTMGQPLRQSMLRSPYIILRGQNVKLMINGRGFRVSSEGHALSDASEGQIVQVRNPAGRIISGLARHNAIVEVNP